MVSDASQQEVLGDAGAPDLEVTPAMIEAGVYAAVSIPLANRWKIWS